MPESPLPQRPPLDAELVAQAVASSGGLWRDVVVLPEIDSTNTYLAEAARGGADEGLVVVAEQQSKGRGRLGRTWVSPPSAGLSFSLLLRPDVEPRRWPWLSLLTGVAVAESVTRSTSVEARLKWPNDVLSGSRKLAGILLERVETGRAAAAVVGVGLNVTTTAAELPVPQATSLLLEAGPPPSREALLRAVLTTFEALYRGWSMVGGDPEASGLRAAYLSRSATIGSTVRVELPDRVTLDGTANSVDDAGRLVVRDATGRDTAVAAGDVVHLR